MADEESVSRQIETLLTYVKSLNLSRPPRTLQESWRSTQQAQEESTPRIFLAEGFCVWFVHFIVKRDVDRASHFDGKADCRNVITDLEGTNKDSRRLFAELLRRAIQSNLRHTIEQFKAFCDNSMGHQTKKRRRQYFIPTFDEN